MITNYSSVVPSLVAANIIYPLQLNQLPFHPSVRVVQVTASIKFSYMVQTQVLATAIMEWNIGVPFPSGLLRQTALDRMDFAY